MPEAFVLETLRTARTKASRRDGFAGISPVALLVSLQRELVRRAGIDPARIDDVIIGCASQNAEQGANIARTATMLADWGDAFGATGAILLGCLADELDQRGGRCGVAAVSGAAGLGVAVLVERVPS